MRAHRLPAGADTAHAPWAVIARAGKASARAGHDIRPRWPRTYREGTKPTTNRGILMCGIAGWVDFERDLTRERAAVTAMTQTMACRGPDGEGLWLSEHAALG